MINGLRKLIQIEHSGGFFLRMLKPPFMKGFFVTDVFRFLDCPRRLTELLEHAGYCCYVERGLGFIAPSDSLLIKEAQEFVDQRLYSNNENDKPIDIAACYACRVDFVTAEFAAALVRFKYAANEKQALTDAERELIFMLLCPLFGTEEVMPRLRRLAAVCLREHRGSAALTLGAAVLLHNLPKE